LSLCMLLHFITPLTADGITELQSVDELGKVFENYNVAILLRAPFSSSKAEVTLIQQFAEVSLKFRASVPFVVIKSADAKGVTIEKLEKTNNISIQMAIPDHTITTKSKFTEQLSDWVTFHNRQFVSSIDSSNFKHIGMLGRNMIIAVLDSSHKNSVSEKAVFHQVAYDLSILSEKVVFATMDSTRYRNYLKKYNARAPCLLVINMVSESFYLFPEDGNLLENPSKLKEAILLASEATTSGGVSADAIVLNSVHDHVLSKGFLNRIKNKFVTYYPWSLFFSAIPIILLLISLLFTSNPRNKKLKQG
jgi:hypothetical protein